VQRDRTFATSIDTPFPAGYDSLAILVDLENRFLQAEVILKQITETLEALAAFSATTSQLADSESQRADVYQPFAMLEWHRTRCKAYSRTAEYLHRRTQSAVQLLTLTLSFQDQAIAKDQNNAMLRLNKAVAFITIISLFYLPANFVSTFFGMNFFGFDEEKGRMVATHMIWIYFLSAVTLTICTFMLYSIRIKVHHKLEAEANTAGYGSDK
jgi:Mg2+ and Co2+ transporter CorA